MFKNFCINLLRLMQFFFANALKKQIKCDKILLYKKGKEKCVWHSLKCIGKDRNPNR